MRQFIIFTLIFFSFSSFGSLSHSILPLLDKVECQELNAKVNYFQQKRMSAVAPKSKEKFRVMSFNMLTNEPSYELKLKAENRWEVRKERLVEYLKETNADLIGTQELAQDQIDYLMSQIGDTYSYFGASARAAEPGKTKPEMTAIFYSKKRFKLLDHCNYYYSEQYDNKPSPFGKNNNFIYCVFCDLLTDKKFTIIDTHFTFSSVEQRAYETKLLKHFLKLQKNREPLIVLGDFNTFPFRQDLDLPFFDGCWIVSRIEESGVRDSQKAAIYGSIGSLSSTNYSIEKKEPFASEGVAGVILDHIFVANGIRVIVSGIDSAKVNGCYPSDHFPVIMDCFICDEE